MSPSPALEGGGTTVTQTAPVGNVVTGNSFAEAGLKPNSAYTYYITPYNATNFAGITTTVVIYTGAVLTYLTTGDGTVGVGEVRLMFDGSFSYYDVKRNNELVFTGSSYDTSYLDTGLVANYYPYEYTVVPYNLDHVAASPLTIAVSTHPLMSSGSISATSVDTQSLVLNFAGSFSTISLKENGTVIAAGLTSSPYTVTGLFPNTTYTFTFVPYTLTGDEGSYAALNVTTLPLLTVPQLTTATQYITASSLTLVFGGSYNYVDVLRDGSLLARNVLASYYVDSSNIVPDTHYVYEVIPYNSTNSRGSSAMTEGYSSPLLTGYTLGNVTAQSIQLNYTGQYQHVNVYRNGTYLASSTVAYYLDNVGITANTTYTYTLVPFNHNTVQDQSGDAVTVVTASAPLLASLVTGSNTTSSVQLLFTGTFTRVNISRYEPVTQVTTQLVINGSMTPLNSGVYAGYYSYRDSDTAHPSVTKYQYTVTPLNATGGAGVPLALYGYKIPVLQTYTVQRVATQTVTFSYTGSYASVNVARNGVTLATNVVGATYTDAADLVADTSYTYTVTPYNPNTDAGVPAMFSVVTLPSLRTVNAGVETATTIQLVYAGNYHSVDIYQNGNWRATVAGDVSYTDTGLTPNTGYTYTVIPYNLVSVSGDPVTLLVYNLPLLDATALSVAAVTTNSVQIAVATGSSTYSYVKIYRGSTLVNARFTGSTFTDTGLTPHAQYTYVFQPFNASDQYGTSASISATTTFTVATVTALSVGAETNDQIQLLITGSYSYVTIARNGDIVAAHVTAHSYVDTSLNTDAPYTYVVTPYNDVDLAGISQTLNACTLPLLTPYSFVAGAVTSNAVRLDFAGTYDSVTITRNGATVGSVAAPATSLYDDAGLNANTSYTYVAIPYNGLAQAGTTASLVARTLPRLSTLSLGTLTTSSVVLSFTGVYDAVQILREHALRSTLIATVVGDVSYTDTGLAGNSSYTYDVVPYHAVRSATGSTLDASGASLTVTASTLLGLNITSLVANGVQANAVQVSFSGSFVYVTLTRTDPSGTAQYNVVTLTTTATGINGTGVLNDTSVQPNTTYSYQAIPYDTTKTRSGTTATLTGVVTLPTVTAVTAGTKTTAANHASSSIPLTVTGNYSYVSVVRGVTTVAAQLTGTTVTDQVTLFNTPYSYVVTPYNSAGVAGAPLTYVTYSTSTLNYAALPYVSSVTTSSLTINWSGTYSYVILKKNEVLDALPLHSSVTQVTASSYTYTGLSAGTAYTFEVIPYNVNGEAGESFVVGSVVTLPTLTSLYAGAQTSTSLQLRFAGTYDHVTVARDASANVIRTVNADVSYTDTGLAANYAHTYYVTPYNINGTAGYPLSITLASLPLLTPGSLVVTSVTSTTETLAFEGSYNYVKVYRNDTFVAKYNANLTGSDTFVDTSLNPNTSYSYTVVPFSSTDVSGTSASVSRTTLPTMSFTQGATDASSIQLRFAGSYRALDLTRNGVAVLSGGTFTDVSYTVYGLSPYTQYTFAATPYNTAGNTGASYSAYYTTGSTITTAGVTAVTTTTVSVYYTGGAPSYLMVRSGMDASAGASVDTSFVLAGNTTSKLDTGLVPGTTYTYRMSPLGGGNTITFTAVTLPAMTTLTIGDITTGSIQIRYTGYYNYVTIARTGGSLGRLDASNRDVSYNDDDRGNVLPTGTYQYTVTPYNAAGVAGFPLTVTGSTSASLSTNSFRASLVTSEAINLVYTGFFNYVNVYRDGSSVPLNPTPVLVGSYLDAGLTPNRTYSYQVVPYNLANLPGRAVGPLSVTSLPTLGSTPTVVPSATSVAFTFVGQYASITVANTTTGTTQTVGTSTTWTDTSLNPNTNYAYVLTPVNLAGVAGTAVSCSTTTLARFTSATLSGVLTNAVQLDVSGAFSTYTLSRADASGTILTLTKTRYDAAAGYTSLTTGLATNTLYTYTLIPYNQNQVAGARVDLSTVTLPSLTSLSAVDSSNQVQLLYGGIYSSVAVARNGTVIRTSTAADTSYTDTSVATDTSYAYTVTPYNSAGVAGTSRSLVTATLGILNTAAGSLYVTNLGSTTAQLNFSGNFTTLAVNRGRDGGASALITTVNADTITSYLDTQLSANVVYIYVLVPYSPIGEAGTSSALVVYTLPSVVLGTGTVTMNTITLNLGGAFSFVDLSRNDGVQVRGVTGTSYTDSSLNLNTPYTYYVTPYNTLGRVPGGAGTTATISTCTLPQLTGSVTATAVGVTSLTLGFVGAYAGVVVTRNGTALNTPSTLVAGTSYTNTGLTGDTNYTFTVTPYNLVGIAGASSAAVSVNTLPVVIPTVSAITYRSIAFAFTGNYTILVLTKNGVFDASMGTTSLVYGYTSQNLNANTPYTYVITPYNKLGQAGTALSSTVYTYGVVTTVTSTFVTGATATINVTGTYASITITRTNLTTQVATVVYTGSGTTFADSSLNILTTYNYVVTPHNSATPTPVAGAPVSLLVTTTNLAYLNNGDFTKQLQTANGSTAGLTPTSWSVSTPIGSGIQYYVAAGSAFTPQTLPFSTTQYFVVANSTVKSNQSLTLSQSATFNVPGTFLFSMVAFAGSAIQSTHTVSVYVGDYTVVNQVSVGSVANSPYRTLNQPFTLMVPGTYTVKVVISCPVAAASFLGIAQLLIQRTDAVATGYRTIDPSTTQSNGLVLYYPFDIGYGFDASGFNLYNCASGYAVLMDGSGVNGAAITTTGTILRSESPLMVGSGYLALTASQQQYVTMGAFTLALLRSGSAPNPGMAVCAWFSAGTQTTGPLCTFATADGTGSIQWWYKTIASTGYLEFSVPGCARYSAQSYPLATNTWYFAAMTVSATGAYTFYVNGTTVGTLSTGVLPPVAGTYSVNCLGYDPATSSYFNGGLDDVRVYTRELSVPDVEAVYAYGVAMSPAASLANVIDSRYMNNYYPFELQGVLTYAPLFAVQNSEFTVYPPVAVNGASSTSPPLLNWSFSSGAVYTVYQGTGAGTFAGTLPPGITNYLGVASSAGKTVTLSQPLVLQLSSGTPTQYMLSFYAFPADGHYQAGHTLTVTVGGQVLVANIALSSGYSVFNLPFTVVKSDTYPVTFAWQSATGNTSSTMCLAGVQVVPTNVQGMGYSAVDPSSLVLYYPFDVGTTVGTAVYDYATGVGVLDASAVGGCVVSSANTGIGAASTGSLSLTAASSQYVAMNKTFTLPSTPMAGAGFAVCGWFYPSGEQATYATLFSLGAGNIAAYYRTLYGVTQYLDFYVNGGTEYIAINYPIVPGSWYFVAVNAAFDGTNTTYSFYVNDTCMNTVTVGGIGAGGGNGWTVNANYMTNYVGYGGTGTVPGVGTGSSFGYFNGAVDDFRVYTRSLSIRELDALWNYGTQPKSSSSMAPFSIIDPTSMSLYYPFDAGTLTNYKLLSAVILSNTSFTYPVVATNSVSAPLTSLYRWSVVKDASASFAVYNGTAGYAYGLPAGVTQYLGVTTCDGARSTFSQSFYTSVASPVQFFLTFVAFPLDGSYNALRSAAQTLTVSVGGVTLLSAATFVPASAGYSTYTLPFVIPVTGTYTLTFAVSGGGAAGSTLGFSGIAVNVASVGMGYAAIAPAALVLYYPMDVGTTSVPFVGTRLYNYATGLGVLDASLNGAANLATVAPRVGSAYLSLSKSTSDSLSLGSFVLGSAGFSVACWFYALGAQSPGVSLISLGGLVSVAYTSASVGGTNAWIDVSCRGMSEYVAVPYPVVPGTWNFLALTADPSGVYTLYWNDASVNMVQGVGAGAAAGSYTSNVVGGGGFNGYVDDVRVYARALSAPDVASLYNYTYTLQGSGYGNVVDPLGLQIFYPFDTATALTYNAVLAILNGGFASPLLVTNGTSTASPSILGWSVSSGASYAVYNGTAGYAYGLPSGVTQYVGVASVAAGGLVTMTQVVPVTIQKTTATRYYLQFVLFPQDGAYHPAHTVSVTVGGVTLLSNVSLRSTSSNTVPYLSYTLPFEAPQSGNYAVTFAFSNPGGLGVTSTIGVTNVRTVIRDTVAVGAGVVDTAQLALYYPVDPGSIVGSVLYDYSGGSVGVADGTVYGGATVGTAAAVVAMGSGYLALNATQSHYVSLGAWTPPAGVTGALRSAGMSICGWFYAVNGATGTQAFNATLFQFSTGVGGSKMTLGFNRNNMLLDFSANGVPEVVVGDLIAPGMWHFVAVTGAYTGTDASGNGTGSYTLYLNDNVVATVSGGWVGGVTYGTNTVGWGWGGQGYFNGYVDDVRAYSRCLSSADVDALWSWGTGSMVKYGNVVDPVGLSIYYPFDQAGAINFFGNFNTLTLAPIAAPTTGMGAMIPNWTVSSGTAYAVYNGADAGGVYSYGLPAEVTQYVAVTGSGTLSQNVTLTLTTVSSATTQYVLSFYVFPADGVYAPGQTVSVYLAGMTLVNRASVAVSSSTVPYVSFTLPFTLAYSGTYALSFVFSGSNTSTMCIAGAKVVTNVVGTAPGAGRSVVDTTGLVHYVPFDAGTSSGTLVYNYGTVSTGVLDVSLNGSAVVSTGPAVLGRGSLVLTALRSASSASSVSLNTVSVSAGASAGFSACGWFYVNGAQLAYANLFSFQSASPSTANVILGFYNLYPWLKLQVNDASMVATTYPIALNAWNFVAVVVSGTSSVVYVNDVSVGQLTSGSSIAGTSYTQNAVGSGLNGYVDDFRVYARALSSQDVLSLWNYGFTVGAPSTGAGSLRGNIIDSSALTIYYPFEQGCAVSYSVPNFYLPLTNLTVNGAFAAPSVAKNGFSVLRSALRSAETAPPGWTVTVGSISVDEVAGSVALYNGTAVYAYGLPSTVTQYLGVTTGTALRSAATTVSQTVTLPNAGAYLVSFYLFPRDGAYQTSQSVTVTLGSVGLFSGLTATASATTVPYTAYNAQVLVPAGGSYTLTFAFTALAGSASAGTSTLCLAGVSVAAVSTGIGYSAVDNSGLSLYYPMERLEAGGSGLSNYVYGIMGTTDAFQSGGLVSGDPAVVATTDGGTNAGYLSLVSAGNQYATLNAFTTPTYGASGNAGMTVTGWFYALGVQSYNAALFSMSGSVGALPISVYFRGVSTAQYNGLFFTVNGIEYFANTVAVPPNTWNFVSVVLSTSVGVTTMSFYVNNVLVQSMPGFLPNGATYTLNTLGYGTGLGYFNGYLDEFRVYGRALSAQEIGSLWNYWFSNTVSVTKYNLIDSNAFFSYYPFEMGLLVATMSVLTIINGKFTSSTPLLMTSGTSVASPVLTGWNATGTYALYNNVNYSYGLPAGVSQYVGLTTTGAGVATLTQSLPFTLSAGALRSASTSYLLTFVAFPRDGSYNAMQTLSVSVGGAVLMTKKALVASGSTVPYSTFALPFSIVASGTYSLTFTVTGAAAAGTSTIGITNVAVLDTSVAGYGFAVVDPTALVLYYPMDEGVLYNYSTGVGVADALRSASLGGGASASGVGSGGALVLGSSSESLSMGPVTVGAGGMSVCGWFRPTAVQVSGATLWSLGSAMSAAYTGTNAWLTFVGGATYTATAYPMMPGVWNFVAWTVTSGGVHSFYMNNVLVGTTTGAYPAQGTTTSNVLGAVTAGTGFNGSIDDFRVYTRTLSARDVECVYMSYSASVNPNSMFSVIDLSGSVWYYPMDAGTVR